MLVHEFKTNRILKTPLEYNVADSDEEEKRTNFVKKQFKNSKTEMDEKVKEIQAQFQDNLQKYVKFKNVELTEKDVQAKKFVIESTKIKDLIDQWAIELKL